MPWSPFGLYTLYKDRKGNIWFGTSNVGLYRYDGKTLSRLYEDHLTNTPEGGSFGIRSIFEDHEGNFWFCNTSYRYKILPGDSVADGESFIRYRKEKGITGFTTLEGKSAVYFMSIAEDDAHNIWLATYDTGIWRFDGKEMKHFLLSEQGQNITIYSVYTDTSGKIWAGTHTSGAWFFNGTSFEKFRP